MEGELPGEKSRKALVVLADFSVFLAPPPSEIPNLAPPKHAEASQIAEKAVQYLAKVIPALPNYLATRITTRFGEIVPSLNRSDGQVVVHQMHFEDAPPSIVTSDRPVPNHSMHLISVSNETVTIRNGREYVTKADSQNTNKVEQTSAKMVSGGEFGTVLIGLITDAFRGKVNWNHWETRNSKPVAVFRYSVTQEDSHFAVIERSQGLLLRVHPAYHGEIAVDPDQGTILRLTLQAEWKPDDSNVRSDIFVEFAPVEVGGKTYYCSSRSVVVSVLHPALLDAVKSNVPNLVNQKNVQIELNDVQYSDYHRFRSEVRLLPSYEPEPAAVPPTSETPTTNPDHGRSQ
jgi:hypothetical protein